LKQQTKYKDVIHTMYIIHGLKLFNMSKHIGGIPIMLSMP